ncbi:unnamed protein product [Lota lota]
MSAREGISCPDPDCMRITETLSWWNHSSLSRYRLVDPRPADLRPADLRPADLRPADLRPADLRPALEHEPTTPVVTEAPPHYTTVDVPDHAHYTMGSVVLLIGITGVIGNSLVIYAFTKSRSLRTPANMFILNMAAADLMMCVTQTPIFFITSMHRRWIFGEKACELYAFSGAVFGICSMLTLTLIAAERFFVITRPLASIGVLSRRRAGLVLMGAWLYSLAWSLPPFFGWSAYVPEGLLTSCSWDYMTFSPSVRAYTMLLFIFVFFIPLFIIIYCYFFIFRAVRSTNRRAALSEQQLHVARRSTVTSQTPAAGSPASHPPPTAESGWTDMRRTCPAWVRDPPAPGVGDISGDTAELPEHEPSSFKNQMKHDSGAFERRGTWLMVT